LTKVIGSPKRIREQTKRYVRENWGFPFIIAFMPLLLTAATLLVTSNLYSNLIPSMAKSLESMDEIIATCAYFALAIGVVLELGQVNSNSVRKDIAQIKEFKIISKCIRFGKNRFNKGAVFHGSD
jgi:hypothetical protein